MQIDQKLITFQDVQMSVYHPELISLDPDKLLGDLTLTFNPKNPSGYKYKLSYFDRVRGNIEAEEDNINKLFDDFIVKSNDLSWELFIQKASDRLFKGLITKNGIFITTDRLPYIQIKSIKDLSTIHNIKIDKENITLQKIITTLEPYIKSLFSSIKEYEID